MAVASSGTPLLRPEAVKPFLNELLPLATLLTPNLREAEVLAGYEKQIPVGRVGRPEEVAHAVLFFACEESGYITGQTLPITGGWF